MADESTTAVEPQAGDPATPQPQAGATTPTEPQAGESHNTAESISLDEARKLRSEAQSLRKRLKAFEDAEQAAKDAQLNEVERVKKLHADAEAKIKVQHAQLITAQVKLAAHAKGIIDPELAALAIQSQIADLDFDDAELADRIEKALDKLLKNKPYLAPPKAAEPTEQAPATPAQTATQQQAPALPAMNPGRSTIPAPGTTTPGKPVRLSDIQWKGRQ